MLVRKVTMDVVERVNPWWFDPQWEKRDRHIRQWE
jgi:hypothetical protein